MARELPFFKLWVKDWETNEAVRMLNLPEVGLFVVSLNHAWVNDGLPEDPEDIARALKLPFKEFSKHWCRVGKCFYNDGNGRLRNKRQEAERDEAIAKSDKAKVAVSLRRDRDPNRLKIESEGHSKSRAERMQNARINGTHSDVEWLELVKKFNGRCVGCGRSDMNLEPDHIIPIRDKDSSDAIENIQPVCAYCNNAKGIKRIDFRSNPYVQMPYVRTTDVVLRASDYDSVSDKALKFSEQNTKTTPRETVQVYREFVARWKEPTPAGKTFPCSDVDLGCQVWIGLVDSGTITADNIPEVFDGLERHKASKKWREGFVLSVPAFLGYAKNGTPAAPRWNDQPTPAEVEGEY